jgi:microcystin degradation protein MlrC
MTKNKWPCAENLAKAYWDVRKEFEFDPVATLDESLELALMSKAPYMISDMGDNPTKLVVLRDVTWTL